MIEFKVLKEELEDLSRSIPNFDVILDALVEHPVINLVVEDDGCADCFTSSL